MPAEEILIDYGLPSFVNPPVDVATWRRVAVILRPGIGSPMPAMDEHVFFDLLNGVGKFLRHDDVRVILNDRHFVPSVDAARNAYFATDAEDREFPERVEFRCQSEVVAVIGIERWDLVGGPEPYHDSVAIAIYTPNDVSAAISQRVREAVRAVRATVRDYMPRQPNRHP